MPATSRTPLQRILDALETRRGLSALALFLFLLIAAVSSILGHAARPGALDADLSALLPESLSPGLPKDLEERLRKRLSASGSNDVVAVFEALPAGRSSENGSADTDPSGAALRKAVLAWEATMLENAALSAAPPVTATRSGLPAAAAGNLLSNVDRTKLAQIVALPPREAGSRLAARAVACLSPGSPRLLGFDRDPFCTFDHWMLERMQGTPWREEEHDGRSWLALRDSSGGSTAYVLFLQADPAATASGKAGLAIQVEKAREAFFDALPQDLRKKQAFTLEVAGVPLFTDAIASRAKSEIAFVGLLSTAGVLLLAVLFFRSLRILLLMSLSVAAGLAFSTGAAFALFGHLSLVTFIFGMTLIGVSIDYGAHWFALREPGETAVLRRRRMAGSLLLAALSSGAAYAVLAVAPMPGLRQMALLAATGLLGALATVFVVFPVLENRPGLLPPAAAAATPVLQWLSLRLPGLPRLQKGHPDAKHSLFSLAAPWILMLGWGLLATIGLLRVEPASGIRDLQGAPESLIAAQQLVSERLKLPSPAQCFLLEGRTPDEALAAEAAVRALLAATPELRNVRATGLAEWLPSEAQQAASRALVRKAVELASARIEGMLGAVPVGPGKHALSLNDLQDGDLNHLTQNFILKSDDTGTALLLLLSGVTPAELQVLETLTLPAGARFIDITRGMAGGLSECRNMVLFLLGAGLVLLFAGLLPKFGRNAWRAVMPAGIGILTAMAVLGLTGHPLTLFAALAMVLLAGLGLDYGIFLTERPDDGRTCAAILFSGLTTMLSFGLLAFSATPALRTFGLTLLSGLVAIWIAAPLLRPGRPDDRRATSQGTSP